MNSRAGGLHCYPGKSFWYARSPTTYFNFLSLNTKTPEPQTRTVAMPISPLTTIDSAAKMRCLPRQLRAAHKGPR